jgi:hypothetical protein
MSTTMLSNEQGCQPSLAAALEDWEVLRDQQPLEHVLYLQPYWLVPWISLTDQVHPIHEMMGPYVGYRANPARLPKRKELYKASASLWKACQEFTDAKWM